jgi:hypothetical protein
MQALYDKQVYTKHMENFSINYHGYTPKPQPPSLGQRLGISGRVLLLPQSNFWIAAEDHGDEIIEVYVAVKTRREVVEVNDPAYRIGSRFVPVIGM